MRKCSYCGKENGDGIAHCVECGTALEEQSTAVAFEPARENDKTPPSKRDKLMMQGFIWLVGGGVVTFGTYLAAQGSGGTYVVTYGAIIYGVVQLCRAFTIGTPIQTKTDAIELLDVAAQCESVDPAKAVALYEDIVRKYPGTRASEEAQRNINVLTRRA